MRKFIAILALFIMAAGCATAPTGEFFSKLETAPKEKALVYVYRPEDNHIGLEMILNGQEIGDLHSSGYFSILLDPGRYAFDRRKGPFSQNFSMDVKAGQVYFVELKIPSDYGKPGNSQGPQFRGVDESAAIINLKNMRKENRIYMKAPAVPEVATQVTLSKLISAFEENQVAFQNTYENKLIKVDGLLSAVSPAREEEATYTMSLEPLEPMSKSRRKRFVVPEHFTAKCYSENKAQFEQLKNGQKLTITGHLNLKVYGAYFIENCVIN